MKTKATLAGKPNPKRIRRPQDEPPPEASLMDPVDGGAGIFDVATDIYAQLMQRYSGSSAIQHRHLIATAAAMKEILLEDSLPLSPFSYFAAAITALSQQQQNDAASAAALATLLSIVLPIVPEDSISPEKAAEAVRILVRVLEDESTGMAASTSSARCVVKCLGVLLGFCDLGDWDSVKVPFEALLKWSVDKRPKVRKCAVVYLENALKSFQSGTSKKKASKLILSLLESNISLADKLGVLTNVDGSESKKQAEAEHSDVVRMLSITKVALPYLSDKVRMDVIKKLVKLLSVRFYVLTRLILNSIEVLLDKVEVETVSQVAEDIIVALSSYVSSKENPKDTVISAANLLKIAFDKIHSGDAGKWAKESFPLGFNAIVGLLTYESDIASESSDILKNMIDHRLPSMESHPVTEGVTDEPESNPIGSICSSFMRMLDGCAAIPNEHILDVLSVLFLKLGRNSFFYMKDIVLKLADIFVQADDNKQKTCHLQRCFGSSVAAMGAENVLSLVPISFSMQKMTCSNMWLLPILKKYTFGASLAYFMEHIVPIAESLERASLEVKKSVIQQDLQACARGVWGLLPAFCRHPNDISQSFHSFVKLLLVRLEKETTMHEDIAVAVQELVKQNKCLPISCDAYEPIKHSSDLLEDHLLEKRLSCFSTKVSRKNIKALSLYSHELLHALIIIFVDSSPEKRSCLKKAISCLASISDSSMTKKIIISTLERLPLIKALVDSGECDTSNASTDDAPRDSISKTDASQWCLILELAASVVEGADEDLVSLIFELTKQALQAGDDTAIGEAYNSLSCVLEGHPGFCLSKMDELVDLLIASKPPADIGCLSNWLTALQILLVHALRSITDVENKKPFLILNEIILALKDCKEEARKTAYDVLLRISSDLGGSSAACPGGPYNRLISMILGYLSGPSPHITSSAVSALSVLVFKEPELCLIVPDIVPSITSLLHTKAVEVIKAVLGFIKVLVSCLEPKDLQNFVSVIVDGILPWSSVSRHHFKSKVTVILEIMIRKCGLPAVKLVSPDRYHPFVKNVSLNRHGKVATKEADSSDAKTQVSDVSANGFRQKKRSRNEKDDESGSLSHWKKRRNQKQGSHFSGTARNAVGDSDKKTNRFGDKNKMSRRGDGPGKPKRNGEKFGRFPRKYRNGGAKNKVRR